MPRFHYNRGIKSELKSVKCTSVCYFCPSKRKSSIGNNSPEFHFAFAQGKKGVTEAIGFSLMRESHWNLFLPLLSCHLGNNSIVEVRALVAQARIPCPGENAPKAHSCFCNGVAQVIESHPSDILCYYNFVFSNVIECDIMRI